MSAVATQPVSTESKVVSKQNNVGSQHLSFDAETYRTHFGQIPFQIKHTLSDHPLLNVKQLLELSQRLPQDCIEYNAGNLPISVDHADTPMNGLSPQETIRRIEECKSWLVLKYVEKDPAYKELLEQCLAQLKPHTDPIYPGMGKPHAFIFITSPGSITPYHIDPEHNFLLQIQGPKEIHLYDGRMKSLLNEVELENFYSSKGRNLVYKDEYENNSWTFTLQPGDGLHFPVTYPHYVKNLDQVSISFSITFRTPDLDKRQALYQQHEKLRSWGMNPPAVGKYPVRDQLLFQGFRMWRKVTGYMDKKTNY